VTTTSYNRKPKVNRSGIFISDIIDFNSKTVKRDKESHCIMIKGSTQQEDITIINIFASNTGGYPNYLKQIFNLQRGTDSKITVVGEFNTLISSMDR
jgi:hypothetical protein